MTCACRARASDSFLRPAAVWIFKTRAQAKKFNDRLAHPIARCGPGLMKSQIGAIKGARLVSFGPHPIAGASQEWSSFRLIISLRVQGRRVKSFVDFVLGQHGRATARLLLHGAPTPIPPEVDAGFVRVMAGQMAHPPGQFRVLGVHRSVQPPILSVGGGVKLESRLRAAMGPAERLELLAGLESGVRNAPAVRVQAAEPGAVDEAERDRLASSVRANGEGRGKPAAIPDGARPDEQLPTRNTRERVQPVRRPGKPHVAQWYEGARVATSV